MYIKRPETRGGPRPNSGPKLKYGERTVQLKLSVPASKLAFFEALIEKELKKLRVPAKK